MPEERPMKPKPCIPLGPGACVHRGPLGWTCTPVRRNEGLEEFMQRISGGVPPLDVPRKTNPDADPFPLVRRAGAERARNFELALVASGFF